MVPEDCKLEDDYRVVIEIRSNIFQESAVERRQAPISERCLEKKTGSDVESEDDF